MLCRYERTIFKSDKGFCIFAYSTSDESVPKEARNRSYYHDDKIHFTAIGYHLIATDAVEWNWMAHGRIPNTVYSCRFQCVRKSCREIKPASLLT